ncbi:biliverdin-producing heme oxygenase [Nocardioidaceae bacterium]|nr:biliverdin-producing heme oxygenase [Nocardioidaceae bacterium]
MTAQPLAARLRQATATAHRTAESTGWAATLATGRVRRATYAAYLAALTEIYAALEDAVAAHVSHPAIAVVHDPGLQRLSALRADLARWGEPAETPAVRAATIAYVDRLEHVARSAPHRLLAHHYVRYLGDLSGGQVVASALRTAGHDGVAFYDFSAVAESTRHGRPSTVPFLRRYREGLDAAALRAREADEVVEEAVRAFDLTTQLFLALDPPAADVTPSAG